MAKIQLKSTEVLQWHQLVKDAQQTYRHQFCEDVEHYLIMLLQNFVNRPEIASTIIAADYLAGQQHPAWRERQQLLRDVGDKCLLFSGLFPEMAHKRNISVSYLVNIGRSAYHGVAESANNEKLVAQLFSQLHQEFVCLMDVLQCISEMRGFRHQISPMLAEELWRKLRSRHARDVLQSWKKAG